MIYLFNVLGKSKSYFNHKKYVILQRNQSNIYLIYNLILEQSLIEEVKQNRSCSFFVRN